MGWLISCVVGHPHSQPRAKIAPNPPARGYTVPDCNATEEAFRPVVQRGGQTPLTQPPTNVRTGFASTADLTPPTVCVTTDATGRLANFDLTADTAFRIGRNSPHRPPAWLLAAIVARIAAVKRNRRMASSPSGEPPGRLCQLTLLIEIPLSRRGDLLIDSAIAVPIFAVSLIALASLSTAPAKSVAIATSCSLAGGEVTETLQSLTSHLAGFCAIKTPFKV